MKKQTILVLILLMVLSFAVQTISAQEEMDFRLTFFLEKIAKAQKAADGYSPETRTYLVGSGEYEWLERAVSPKAREEWSKKWLTKPNEQKKFNEVLDALAATAAKKLPLCQTNPKAYTFRNPAEETMMKAKLENLVKLKVHKLGFKESAWLIDKNNLGIPTARYKHGMLWVLDETDDHPYCKVFYINIIQDYTGGGTYGASYAKLIGNELAGCPVGK